jgi:hypothetical protein
VSGKSALPPLVLNVPALAGRSEPEVSSFLGPPDPGADSSDPNRTKRCYQGGKIEIIFVEGKAGWVKLYGSGDLPFSKDALRKLGLPVKRPTYVNAHHVMSWHNIPNLREVSLYGGGPRGSASSVLVCVQPSVSATGRNPARRFSFPSLRVLRALTSA